MGTGEVGWGQGTVESPNRTGGVGGSTMEARSGFSY